MTRTNGRSPTRQYRWSRPGDGCRMLLRPRWDSATRCRRCSSSAPPPAAPTSHALAPFVCSPLLAAPLRSSPLLSAPLRSSALLCAPLLSSCIYRRVPVCVPSSRHSRLVVRDELEGVQRYSQRHVAIKINPWKIEKSIWAPRRDWCDSRWWWETEECAKRMIIQDWERAVKVAHHTHTHTTQGCA